MKSNRDEITLYERLYRKRNPLLVKSGYHVCVTRLHYWMMKHDPYMKDMVNTINANGNRILQRVDINDTSEIRYMFNAMLNHAGIKIYLVYSNGSRRRIKLGRFSFRRFR